MTAKKSVLTYLMIAVIIVVSAFGVSFGSANAEPKHQVTVVTNGECDDYYKPASREWQAIATIESSGKRLWASWMAGGVTEPDPDNHIIVAYSDDNGDTWVDPFIIVDDGGNKSTRLRDPVLWLDDVGKLWLFYGFSGTYAVVISNPEAAPSEIEVSMPRYVFAETILNKPIITSWGEWMCTVDPYKTAEAYRVGHVYYSKDKGNTWLYRSKITSTVDAKQWHEATMVEKKDGSLWCVSRIERGAGGGLEQAFSTDKGNTWTNYQYNLQAPFRGPGSKCAMMKLSSGNYLFVNNESTSARINMTAYLSEDEGKTWKYLLLDSRLGCAYPDIAEDKNGNIYVIWDYGRTAQNEIRIARFREEDVKNGVFHTENAKNMLAVAKDGAYSDIVSVAESYPHTLIYKVGDEITKEAIIASLPTEINAVTDKGENLKLSGSWDTSWFSSEYAGVYTFKFTYSKNNLPENVSDNLGLLSVKVLVKSPEKKGCGSAAEGASLLISVAMMSFIFIKTREKKNV